ncbi:rRNA maturation RNase YbeY [Algoriphagus halophytocola]|uniref:Endoribonuclease YbeY n=1 Tax=Algoriphagus halophytocola TaxID=2991499 RepID=A0ABY6MG09_9BACT|nr:MULTISPECIES: rRNA maturation RNase YbeY [unclassified Algoriphagus]UZD21556.1 rRNA maturation RNase YbeY [Algoriphagus sp. TR-M5]WBL42768.1 rRNA maturation RNase YbeY [Algoriphagus sp. TR-M9]
MAINFFTEEVNFILTKKNKRKSWLKEIANSEGFSISELNFIFCSDHYLHEINLEYLNHDTYTDIITFDNSEKEKVIEGDIFISVERVKENSEDLGTELEKELNRVISHGLFHLLGFKDKTDQEAKLMRQKENFAIELFDNT